MAHSWQPLGNTAPPAQTWVLVYAPDVNPCMQVALWPGYDRVFLVRDTEGKEVYLPGTVTHWQELPATPAA